MRVQCKDLDQPWNDTRCHESSTRPNILTIVKGCMTSGLFVIHVCYLCSPYPMLSRASRDVKHVHLLTYIFIVIIWLWFERRLPCASNFRNAVPKWWL